MTDVGPIVNGKISDTCRVLSRLMRHPACEKAAIASAYISNRGLRSLLPSIKRLVLQRGRNLQILTGVKDYFTDPEALITLERLARRSNGRLVVKVSRNPRFHAKLYLIELAKKSVVIIGSANMTSEGLTVDGELSAQIQTPNTDAIFRRFWRWFEREFANARKLDERLIEVYREGRKARLQLPVSSMDKRLLAILRATVPERGDLSRNEETEVNGRGDGVEIWRTTIQSMMSDKGMAQLKDAATWYTKHEPEFICYPNLPTAFEKVRKGDTVVVFDYSGGKRKGWVKIARVLEVQEYPPTDDGRYFLVLRYRKNGRKRLTPAYRRSLVERRVLSSNVGTPSFVLQRLGSRTLEILKQDFDLPGTRHS